LPVEERRGSWLDRLARLSGRGREETTPVALHIAVFIPIALFVGVLIAVALVIWLALR
jgi:hypothetical protein